MTTFDPWWGEFTLEVDQSVYWSIGERQIIISRQAAEWRAWNIDGPEPDEVTSLEHGVWGQPDYPVSDTLSRHLFTTTPETIKVTPALADRPVTTRPATPLNILPNEEVRLYVSTPVWFRVFTVPNATCFFDQPLWRPSDSWFGPSTIEGELCYAKHTDARLQLDLLERRAHRAITPITVINNSGKALLIERLSLPVPMLRLYADEYGQLWTDAITVTREVEDEATALTLDKKPPTEASKAKLISEPRVEVSKNRLIRSLSSLFA